MRIFRPYLMSWWHVSLLKISMLIFGIAIGTAWPQFFAKFIAEACMVAVIPVSFLALVTLRQSMRDQDSAG